MTETPMSSERLEEFRMSYSGFPEDAIPLLEEKADLIGEVDRLKEVERNLQAQLQHQTDHASRLRAIIGQVTASLKLIERTLAKSVSGSLRWRSAAARQRKLAEESRPAETTASASEGEELVPMTDERLEKIRDNFAALGKSLQPVLWLFRDGDGPVYASRRKPEPKVLMDVQSWTVEGETVVTVSLPLRDWVRPGQRMALVPLPIGGDA